jgi:hypothetical protein
VSEAVVATGVVEPIEALIVDVNNNALTGLTDIKIDCRRKSDGKLLDWNDFTFKSSGWTQRQLALTETDATNEAGWYRYSFNMGSIVSPIADDVYTITVRQTSLTTAKNVPQTGTIRTGVYVDTIASKLDVTVGSRAAAGAEMALVDNAITAAKVATDAIDADALKVDAVTKIQAGLATTTDVTTARDHIEAHGDAGWATATGFASTADVGAAVLAVLAGITTDHGAGSYLAPATVVLTDSSLTAAKVGAGYASTITAGIATTAQLDAHALAIKGASFDTNTDSLRAIRVLVSAIPTAAAPSAASIRDTVWTIADDGATGTALGKLTLLHSRQTGRRKMGLDGYELIYGPDNVTVIKKTLVKDINGDIVVPAAGDPSEVSQEIDP